MTLFRGYSLHGLVFLMAGFKFGCYPAVTMVQVAVEVFHLPIRFEHDFWLSFAHSKKECYSLRELCS